MKSILAAHLAVALRHIPPARRALAHGLWIVVVAASFFALAGLIGCATTPPSSAPGTKASAGAKASPGERLSGCVEAATPFVAMQKSKECDKCKGLLLPGRAEPISEFPYTIWSDLPEVFCSSGVLYTTWPQLPAPPSGPPPEPMRLQTSPTGWTFVDGSFQLFLWHTVYHCQPASPPKRVVIYARNDGAVPVEIAPAQILLTDGTIGTTHEMESTLGRRVLENAWDRPLETVTIAPGKGGVIGYSKRFADSADGPDQSINQNCLGMFRAEVKASEGGKKGASVAKGKPQLTVYVVAIDAAPPAENQARAEALLNQGAVSGDTIIDMTTPPSGCQVRRQTGVFPSFVWRSAPVVIDAARLTPQGLSFLTAAWEQATLGCLEARQTATMLLHPPYTRPDTIGNYMVDYRVTLKVVNSDPVNKRGFDVRFGKDDADIGLAWRVAVGAEAASDAEVDARPVRTGWSGPKQASPSRSFLAEDGGPIILNPCQSRVITVHFLVLGNSSLPFDITLTPVAAMLR